MNVVCPACLNIVLFSDAEWARMGASRGGCVTGDCPNCGVNCCFICEEVYDDDEGWISSLEYARNQLNEMARATLRQNVTSSGDRGHKIPTTPKYPF